MVNLHLLQDLVSSIVSKLEIRQYILQKYGTIEWGNREQLMSILSEFGVSTNLEDE